VRARLLLDSELVLWALAAPARLTRELRALLDGADVYVSAASVLEIGLRGGEPSAAAEVLAALEPSGFRPLAVTAEHAALAARLALGGSDPLERLLVAQATAEGMTLVTTDAALAATPAGAQRVAARGRPPRGQASAAERRRARAREGARRPRAEPVPQRCPIVLAAATAPRRRGRS